MPKTVRFGDLVRQSGRPEALTLWTDPKAIRENRVLTVIQEPTGKKKDFGQIGFHRSASALYFVFPHPLVQRGDGRVVGINYELAEDAEPEGLLAAASAGKKPARQRVSPAFGTLPAEKPAVESLRGRDAADPTRRLSRPHGGQSESRCPRDLQSS